MSYYSNEDASQVTHTEKVCQVFLKPGSDFFFSFRNKTRTSCRSSYRHYHILEVVWHTVNWECPDFAICLFGIYKFLNSFLLFIGQLILSYHDLKYDGLCFFQVSGSLSFIFLLHTPSSTLLHLNLRIKSFQLDSSIGSGELPIHTFLA